jgi:hypothetical protein
LDVDEFQLAVGRASGLGADNPFVSHAVREEEVRGRGQFLQSRIGPAANRAREIDGGYVVAAQNGDDETPDGLKAANPGASLISKALAKRLHGWAVDLRGERWPGREGAPFSRDEGAAADWIEAESASDREQWVKGLASKADVDEKIRHLADLAGLDVSPRVRLLDYGRPGDGHVKHANVFPGTFLDRLARETKRVSERTAFQPSTLTGYVLTGLQPLISRVRITRTNRFCDVPGDRIPSRWVTLRFNTADVTFEEVRSLYGEIREFFGASNTEPLGWPEVDFVALVDEMGGPPEHQKTHFWQEVVRRWKEHPASEYSKLNSWRAARNKYERLDDRVGVRELMTPSPPPPPLSRGQVEELFRRYSPSTGR